MVVVVVGGDWLKCKTHLMITETFSTIDFEVVMIRRGGVFSPGDWL